MDLAEELALTFQHQDAHVNEALPVWKQVANKI